MLARAGWRPGGGRGTAVSCGRGGGGGGVGDNSLFILPHFSGVKYCGFKRSVGGGGGGGGGGGDGSTVFH